MSRYIGGMPIEHGGFGCVFKPPLKCQDGKHESGGVSKLMLKDYAIDEFDEIRETKLLVSNVPNYQDYFLLDNITKCKPAPLSEEDLRDFDKVCKNLTKKGINKANVNEKISELNVLNMADGGDEVSKVWKKTLTLKDNSERIYHFKELNYALINLLKHGILELNLSGVYHFDIKDSNILCKNEETMKARLIDWGMAFQVENSRIPDILRRRGIHYNLPFTNILFIKDNQEMLRDELENASDLDSESIKIVARRLVNKFLKTNKGHSSLINSLLKRMYSSNLSLESLIYYSAENIIANHVAEALTHFVNDDGVFEEQRYFEEVFLKNVDVWGFIVAYIEIIETADDLFQSNTMPNKLLHIFYKYWVSPRFSAEPIFIPDLLEELESLNTVYESNNTLVHSSRTSRTKSKSIVMRSSTSKPKGTTVTTRKSANRSTRKSANRSTRKTSQLSGLRKKLLKLTTKGNTKSNIGTTSKIGITSKIGTKRNQMKSTTIIKRETKYRLPKNRRCRAGSRRCSRKKTEEFCCYKEYN